MKEISDTVGTVLIEVQPDLSGFERDLTKGLRDAADNAQKSAATSFSKNNKFIQEGQKSVTKYTNSSSSLNEILSQLSFNLDKNSRALNNFNRSMKDGAKSAQGASSGFSKLVEVVANLAIVFNAVQSIHAFIDLAGGADLAAKKFGDQLKILGHFFVAVVGKFAKNVGEITKTQRAFNITEKAVTKTGRAVKDTGDKVFSYGKATKKTVEEVRRAEQAVKSKTASVSNLAGKVDRASKSEGVFGKTVSGVKGILSKFKDETGAANLNLLTGGKIVDSLGNALKRLGNNATKAAKSVRSVAVTGAGSAQRILSGNKGNETGKIADSAIATFNRLKTTTEKAAKSAAGALASYATTAGGVAKTVLIGSNSNEFLNKTLRQTVSDGHKANGIVGVFDATLRKFGVTVNKGGKELERFNIISKIMGESARQAVGKLGTTVTNTFKAMGRSVDSLGGVLGTAEFASGLGTLASGIGILVAGSTAAGGAITLLAQKASTLAESTNAFGVTMGDAGPPFQELIGNSQELGLSQNKLQQSLTPLTPILRSAGLEGGALATKMDELVRRGVDLSSIFNEDVGTSLQSMTAAIRGEIEPARRLGITFNAAEVEAKALSLGFEKVDGELSESAKQFTRLELVLEKSTFAEGDFANTSTELANSQRILGAMIDDTTGKISAAFLPAAKKIIIALTAAVKNGDFLVDFFKAAEPTITEFGGFIAKLIETLVQFGGTITKALLPVLEVLSPVIAAITKLIGGFITKLVAIALVTSTLKTIAAAAALLSANIGGISFAIKSLIPGVGGLSKVLFTAAGIATIFGSKLSATSGIFGVFGDVLKIASELLKVFVVRVVALRAIGPALIGLNYALKSLSFGKLALGSEKIKGLTASFGKFLSSPAGLIAVTAAMYLFNRAGENVAKTVENIQLVVAKAGTAKGFEEFTKSNLGLMDTFKVGWSQTIKAVKKDGIVKGGLITPNQIIENETLDRTKARLSEIFKTDIAEGSNISENFVKEAERIDHRFAGPLRTLFEQLKADANALGTAIVTAFDKQNEALQKVIDKQKALEVLNQAVVTAEKAVTDARQAATEASEAVTEALQGEIEAKERVTEITDKLTELEVKRQEVLADITRDVFELADAEDALVSIEERLRDIGQERTSVLKEIAELSKPVTAEEYAAADREITKATIDLNRAKRDEQKLLDELNKTQQDNIDLTGLSLDQLKTSLADIRARTAAQRAKAGKSPEKTEVELAEEKTLARIGTIEAEETLKRIQEEREKLDTRAIDNADDLRELHERLITIDRDEAGIKRDMITSQTALNLLKDGETSRAIELRGIDTEITGLAKDKRIAEEGVATAARATRDAVAEEKIAVGEIKTAQAAVLQAIKDQKYESILLLGTEEEINRALVDRIGHMSTLGAQSALAAAQGIALLIKDLPQAQDESTSARRDMLIWNPQIIADMILNNPNKLRDLLRNLGVPGAAEGAVIQGVPSAFGKLIRVGEFGRAEAILPLTKPAQLQDVLMNSQVLSPVLSALGRISLSDAVRPSILGASPGLAPSLIRPRSSGSTTTESRKPTRMEQKLDRLIQLMEESNSRELKVDAPITVTTSDPDRAARQTVKQLKRRLDNQSRLRR